MLDRRIVKFWDQAGLAKVASLLGLISLSFGGIMAPAIAHHAMGGKLPTNLWQGLLSGIAHPIIGLDHFCFVIAIGLVAARQKQGIWLPFAFLVTALVGTGMHVQQATLPLAELGVALSLVLLGLILGFGQKLHPIISISLAAASGLFHGYAYGESIVGAESAPLMAYLLGFTLIQLVIALAAFWLSQPLDPEANQRDRWVQYFGYGTVAVGVAVLATNLGI